VFDARTEDLAARRVVPERLQVVLQQRPLPDEQLALHPPGHPAVHLLLAGLGQREGDAANVIPC